MGGNKFPWELLKAECLRLVCAQLVEASSDGQNPFKPGRKEEMVTFLHDVHDRGVLQALQDVEPPKTIKGPDSSTQQATPSKRKSPPVDGGEEDAEGESDNEDEEGYNTRYKGVKRVKVHGPTPERQEPKPKRKVGRPRKSVLEGGSVVEVRKRGRPRKTISASGEGVIVSKGKGKVLENRNGEDVGDALPSISVSRGRGRPRKKEVPTDHGRAKTPRQSTNTDAPKSKDSGREVFDGIVLVKRNANGKEKAIEEVAVVGDVENGDTGVYGVEVLTGPQDLERDDSEENAVVAVVNGDAQGDLSSLGGSNKENEVSETYTPSPEEGHHEVDLDADGEFEPDAEV